MSSALAATLMGAVYWLRHARFVARVYLQPVYRVMSIYIVVSRARHVCVILKILLHIYRKR